MADSMKDTGNQITCMDKAFIPGKMAEGTRVNTRETRSTVSGSTCGLTAAGMKATGSMASSTARANTYYLMAPSR